ncbi:MAG: ribonuclease P protein component [Solobacterium sp.]|nr:ribonuclease P protein component [Solobacterium sp.]MBR3364833.1 ribonuclease P protein component [Solobacterium sp.]
MKKKNRVRKAQEFQKMIKTCPKNANHSFVMYHQPKAEDEARIGITLSRKIGNAVERNLIKRQVRMMCQDLIRFDEYPYDCVLIVRFGYKEHTFETNKNNLEKLFRKATM